MSSALPSLVAAVMLLPAAHLSQPAVNFAGTWTMVPDRSESPQQSPPVNALTFVIEQTATELNVQTTRDGRTSTRTYAVAASANAPARTTSGDAGRARAYWDGPRLVTEQAGEVQGQTVSTRQIFGLNGEGTEMTVETLVVVQHGYTLRGAKNYGTKTDVFVKVQ